MLDEATASQVSAAGRNAMDSQRANDLVKQAEKKLNSFSFFGLNKSAQYDAASSLLEKAANQYKLSKNCRLP